MSGDVEEPRVAALGREALRRRLGAQQQAGVRQRGGHRAHLLFDQRRAPVGDADH